MPCPLAEAMESQRIWTNKAQYVDAERKYHTKVRRVDVTKRKLLRLFFLDLLIRNCTVRNNFIFTKRVLCIESPIQINI